MQNSNSQQLGSQDEAKNETIMDGQQPVIPQDMNVQATGSVEALCAIAEN